MDQKSVGEYKKIVKDIIEKTLSPLCINHSFKKSGNNFYKVEPEFIKFIELEFFLRNTYVFFAFWFNVHMVYGRFGEEKKITMKTLLQRGEALFHQRSGIFLNEENHMYSITPATDIHALNRKIKEDFETFVFPFYNKFTHLNDVIQYLIEENKRLGNCVNSFRLAVIMAKMGRKEESKKFFKESVGLKEAIVQAARYHGIDLDD